jgi:hypothetical protein
MNEELVELIVGLEHHDFDRQFLAVTPEQTE